MKYLEIWKWFSFSTKEIHWIKACLVHCSTLTSFDNGTLNRFRTRRFCKFTFHLAYRWRRKTISTYFEFGEGLGFAFIFLRENSLTKTNRACWYVREDNAVKCLSLLLSHWSLLCMLNFIKALAINLCCLIFSICLL